MERYAKNGLGGITPLVSVIIPVFNVAPYLREGLDSVINQTYKNLQVLIVDDGSTDGSSAICDEYRTDPRVKVIHQKNGGLSNARNTGLDHTTGDYIAFLDPDDAFHPSFIEELLSAIDNADIALCRYSVHKTDGGMSSEGEKRGLKGSRGPRELITGPGAKAGTYDREDSLRMLVNGTINCSVWNKLYRAELWSSSRFPDGYNFEDIDTMFRIIDLCKNITVIDPILYYHRQRPGSITQTLNWKNINDQKRAVLHLEEFVRSHTPEIFAEGQLQKIRSSCLNGMIVNYTHLFSDDEVQKEDLRKEIITVARQIGVKNCTIRCRAAFFLFKYSPWLLKKAYSVYLPFRLLVFRMIGR